MEITRQRKKKDVMNDKRRALAKEKLISGNYSPLQYLQNVSHSLSDTNHVEKPTLSDITDDSEYSDETEIEVRNPVCVVCLQIRDVTYLFLPCRHANCCQNCSELLEQLNQPCPTCRTSIESRLRFFNNHLLFIIYYHLFFFTTIKYSLFSHSLSYIIN